MSMLIKAGAFGGMISGIALGAMVSPAPGMIVGAICGTAIGVCAGFVMDREDRRKSARSRELDDIIGTTSGSLGRSSMIPPLPSEEVLREAAQRRWVTEWMTPAPPAAR
ncbi:MAG: hypothetical protein KIT84_37165 [Labilithrix sp.]|nr:hypothetical protein [Labilithrix sp.]MCW5816689.1 hypothetical protein [Labilithrix sp.]